VETGEQIGETILDNIYQIEINSDGTILATTDKNNLMYLWDLGNNQLLSKNLSKNANSLISDIVFHPGGNFFSVSNDVIEYWDIKTGESLGVFHSLVSTSLISSVNQLAISPDGKLLLCGGWEGIIRMWALYKDNGLSNPFWNSTGKGTGLAYSKDGKTLAVTGVDSDGEYVIHLWNTGQMTHVGDIGLGEDPEKYLSNYYHLIFHPDGYLIFAGIKDEVRFFDPIKLESIGESIFSGDHVNDMALSPDGKTLAFYHSGHSETWDLSTHQIAGEPILDQFYINFSPDGLIYTTIDPSSMIRFWDYQNRQPLGAPIQLPDIFETLAFSPDSKLIASSDISKSIRLWDVKTREQVGGVMTGHIDTPSNILFNNDGSILISAGRDATIRLWDVKSQQPIGQPITGANSRQLSAAYEGFNSFYGVSGHEVGIVDILLSPDGSRLVSKDSSGKIRIWDMEINSWIEKACTRAGRNLTRDEWILYLPFESYQKTCQQFQ
jgi:WD40 repeat protein